MLAGKAGISLALIPVTGGLSMFIGGGAIAIVQQAIRRVIKECLEEVVSYIVSALTEPAVAALENAACWRSILFSAAPSEALTAGLRRLWTKST